MSGPGGRRRGRHPDLHRALVCVLHGGTSDEREVSLRTGEGVRSALADGRDGAGPERVLAVEVEPDGAWSFEGERRPPAAAIEVLDERAVFFLALHGGPGEDGTLQGLLDQAGRIHTGSGVRASALCMDKQATRLLAREGGLAIAPGRIVDAGTWNARRDAELERARGLSERGWVVKPRCGGSSVHTFLVDGADGLPGAIDAVLETGDQALVEARVPGTEVSCGVLGNAGSDATVLPPIEILPADGRFFDYEQKYAADGAREVCPPQRLDPAAVDRVTAAAERAHRLLGCDGYSRSDFIVDARGEPVLLEVNTLPGLTERSLLPQEAAAAGCTYRELVLEILALALERGR